MHRTPALGFGGEGGGGSPAHSDGSGVLPVVLVPAFVAGQIVIPTDLGQECLMLRIPRSNLIAILDIATSREHGPAL